jgi:hypothetical protein
MGLDRGSSAGFNSRVVAVVDFWVLPVIPWSEWRKNGFGGPPSARSRTIVAAILATGLFLILAAQPADAADNTSQGSFPSLRTTTITQPIISSSTTQLDSAQLRPRELTDSPMAPLPPAVVAGPIGIMLASWMAHRANRRGGKI